MQKSKALSLLPMRTKRRAVPFIRILFICLPMLALLMAGCGTVNPPTPWATSPTAAPTVSSSPSAEPATATATAIPACTATPPGSGTTKLSWSRILFTYNHAGATELWTIDPTSGKARRQIRPNEVIHDPAMSSSGDVIAYIRIPDSIDRQSDRMSELWLMDKDGSDPRPLYIPRANHGVYHPVWLHDSQEIYFQQYSMGSPNALFRIPVAGGEATAVLSDCLDFALSPDGEQLVSMTVDRRLLSVRDGGDVREIAPQPVALGDYGLFAFSPDGRRLAFRGSQSAMDSWNLYVMDLSDLHVRRLTDLGPFHPFTPSSGQVTGLAWTSDGTRLVYSVDGHPKQEGIWVINIEGGERRRLFIPDEWAKVQGQWFE